MKIQTHNKIDQNLCGIPKILNDGFCQIELVTTDKMKVDESGLVHGGFVFGLADYSAMLAINHPNVVLGASQVKFLKPVKTGDTLLAESRIISKEGKRQMVSVAVKSSADIVFEGEFTCFVLEKHVLTDS